MRSWLLVSALLLGACGPDRGPVVDFKAAPLKAGGDVTFSKAYAGKPALIYVWATWCGPCREVAPKLEELKREYASRGVSFIAVSQEASEPVRTFERQTPHDMDVFIDTLGTLSSSVDTSAIPSIVLVDSEHRTVIAERGSSPDTIDNLRKGLESLATPK